MPNQNQTYDYDVFPQLTPEFFVKPSVSKQQKSANVDKYESEEIENLQKLEEMKWAKYMLECIYHLWFYIFNIMIRNEDYTEHYSILTNFAILFIQELKKKSIIPTETIFRYVIEACGYYGKAE